MGEQKIGYLAIYSCFLCLQKYIKRYVAASTLSYEEIARFFLNSRDFDIAEYAESYMAHLISTEGFELVIDGCQYTRPEKTEKISDWNIAQNYLNVCINPMEDGHNCSYCSKCMRTLLVLEAMGKLEQFKNVFDIEKYKKESKFYKYKFVTNYGKDSMSTSLVDYVKEHHLKMPSRLFIHTKFWAYRVTRKIIRTIRK